MRRALDWLSLRFPRAFVAVLIVAIVAVTLGPMLAVQWAIFRVMESRCDGTWHEGLVAGRWSGWCDERAVTR